MIPPRRFLTLLQHAHTHQRQQCIYHNSPRDSNSFSLFTNHQCDKASFPRITTAILAVHTDEVWNVEWSHDGVYLASAGKDKSAIIWRIGVSGFSYYCNSVKSYIQIILARNGAFLTGIHSGVDFARPSIWCWPHCLVTR
jgi:WD40 repeat protein